MQLQKQSPQPESLHKPCSNGPFNTRHVGKMFLVLCVETQDRAETQRALLTVDMYEFHSLPRVFKDDDELLLLALHGNRRR